MTDALPWSGETLNAALRGVNLSAPSTTKFRALEIAIAGRAEIDASLVYATYVSKPGNARVRFDQSDRASTARLGVAVLPSLDVVAGSVRGVMPHVGPGRMEAICFVARIDPDDWHLVAILSVHAGALAERLRGTYPDADVTWIEGTPAVASATRLPGPHAVALPLVVDDRVRRMIRVSVASSSAVILVGPPGTGKTRLVADVVELASSDPEALGLSRPHEAKWVTPEEGWTTRELVGGETVDENGLLAFRPGHVLDAIAADRWLILDEANRADMDKIFGALLTWLSDQPVELGRASTAVAAPIIELGWADGPESVLQPDSGLDATWDQCPDGRIRFLAGGEWRLIGTYNAQDAQRVFRFGQAIGRRFLRVPIQPIDADGFRQALAGLVDSLDPPDLHERVVQLYAAHLTDERTRLGPAVFLRIPSYVRNALRQSHDADLDEVLAEGYLVNVGTWLARLDPETLQPLRERVTPGALSDAQWSWIVSYLSALT